MFQEMMPMSTSGGGGGTSSPVVAYDSTRLLHTITSQQATWTATEDCALDGSFYSSSQYNCNIFVDGYMLVYGKSGTFGYQNKGLFIKKGNVITTNDVGTYSLHFYGLA